MRKTRKEQLAETGIFHEYFQGHNQSAVFQGNEVKERYIDDIIRTLKKPAISAAVQIFGFCVMGNHVHAAGQVVPEPGVADAMEKAIEKFGDFMRDTHSRFAQWFNHVSGRSGAVFNGRPKTDEVDGPLDVLQVMLYCDANPVAAGRARHPSAYPWSSYQYYAYGKKVRGAEALTEPEAYLALGKTRKARQRAYRSLTDANLRRKGLLNDAPDEDVIDLSMYETGMECILALIAMANCREGPLIA